MSFDIFEVFVRSSDDIAVEKVKEFIEKNPTKLNKKIEYRSKPWKIRGTLLHFSCYWNNHPKVVSYLLSKNADVTKSFFHEGRDFDGLTAKQIAEKRGFGNIVTLFEQYEREQYEISYPILSEVEEKPVPIVKPSPNPQPKPVIIVKPSPSQQKSSPALQPSPIPQPKPVPVVKPSPNPQPVEEKPDPALQPIPQPKPVPDPQPEKSATYSTIKAKVLHNGKKAILYLTVSNLSDIQEQIKKKLNIIGKFRIEYLDKDFGEFAELYEITELRDLVELQISPEKENNTVTSIPITDKIPLFDHIATRVTDVSKEPLQILDPIIGLLDIPLCSFDETLQSLETHVPGIENFSFACTMFAKNIDNNKKQKLTNDEISSINLYTRESNPREKSIYFILNKALRDQDRMALKPFFPYLHLLLHSMSKLPKCSPGTIIWRGVQTNISSEYERGKIIIWWGLSSCTKDMKTLDTFLDKNTDRTLFSVQINSAIKITQFSAHPKEEEVLVFPCVTFEVQNVYSPSKGLWIVQLMEIYSPAQLIQGFDFLGK